MQAPLFAKSANNGSPLVALADLTVGQEADCFALLTAKEELTTRDGKPYFKVAFRDARREVSFPIWNDSPWCAECRTNWTIGTFYKLRAVYRESNYGPQLEIRKIRAVNDSDAAEGFDPMMCLARSRFDSATLFDELTGLARESIKQPAVRELTLQLLCENRAELLTLPAATRNHHAFVGGWLEHVVSVTRTAIYLADKYGEYYADMQPPLNKDLVVAGAILHDIGKLRELEQRPSGADYTAAGHLIGHLVQGRDMVREAAAEVKLPVDMLLRLEHILLAHQRLPEWGSPKPPMTPEALLVHYADDLDAKYNMLHSILREDTGTGVMTSKRNVLTQAFYKGEPPS